MPEMFYDWNYLTCGISANLPFTYVVIADLLMSYKIVV